jgi:hypothetical protein
MSRRLCLVLASMILLAGSLLATATGSAGAATAPIVYGVNVHPESPLGSNWLSGAYDPSVYTPVLDSMQAAGAQVVRLPVAWAWLEPTTKGVYGQTYLNQLDAYVSAAAARGLRVLLTTTGPPCWATSYPNPDCGHYIGTNAAIYPPRSPSDESDYAAFIAQRWRSDLAGVEALNEPNDSQYFAVPASDDPARDYVNVEKAVFAGVKSVAPEVPVVAGALAYSDGNFLKRAYADGVKSSSDAISIHPYDLRFSNPFSYWGDPSQPFTGDSEHSFATGVPWIESIMSANGDASKPLWLTEFGFSSCYPSYICMDETTAAAYLSESLSMLSGWTYVKVAIIHQAYDASSDLNSQVGGSWNGFGLVRNDFSRKPAYCVFVQAATGGACTTDALSFEGRVRDSLTRAWWLSRGYYMAHKNTFKGFNGAALHAAESSFAGYDATKINVAPSPDANPSNIGINVYNNGANIEMCNVSTTTAYCVNEQTGKNPFIHHGKYPGPIWSASFETNNGASSTW